MCKYQKELIIPISRRISDSFIRGITRKQDHSGEGSRIRIVIRSYMKSKHHEKKRGNEHLKQIGDVIIPTRTHKREDEETELHGAHLSSSSIATNRVLGNHSPAPYRETRVGIQRKRRNEKKKENTKEGVCFCFLQVFHIL